MAYLQINTTAKQSNSGAFARGFLASIREAFECRKVYYRTLSELNALSNSDLADLGLSRSGLKRTALEAAYGKNI